MGNLEKINQDSVSFKMGEQEDLNEMVKRTAEANGSDFCIVRNGSGEVVNIAINKIQQNVGEENKMEQGNNGHDDDAPDFQPDFEEEGEGTMTLVRDRGEGIDVLVEDAEEETAEEGNMSMGAYTPEQAVAAQNQVAEEQDAALDDYFDGVKTSQEQKNKVENNGTVKHNKAEEDIKSKLRRMDAKLEEDLAPLLKAEETRLKEMQYTGIVGYLKRIFTGSKPVDKNKVLDNVINSLLYEAEEIVEKRKLRKENREGERRGVNEKLREMTKLRNSDYDKYELGEKHLKSLEEQLTKNNKVRNTLIEKKSKPGYKGEDDYLLNNTVASIDRLEQRRIEVQEGQEILYENIQDYNAKLDVLKEDAKEADVHYFIAKSKLQKASRIKDDLVKLRDDRGKRESLLQAYIESSKEEEPLKYAGKVSKGARDVIIDIIDSNADYACGDQSGTRKPGSQRTKKDPFKRYEETIVKTREDVIAKARAERYNMTN